MPELLVSGLSADDMHLASDVIRDLPRSSRHANFAFGGDINVEGRSNESKC